MKLASLDIGTNTTLFLLAEVGSSGKMTVLEDLAAITRLGEGVDGTGRLGEPGIRRTLEQIRFYRGIWDREKADRVIAVATSAVREAANGREFVDRAENELGLRIRILSGEEEARLSFRAASDGIENLSEPYVVADIGGGTTELVHGARGEPLGCVSLPLGSVRLTERFLKSDPVSDGEFESMRGFVDAKLAEALSDWRRFTGSLVGIAGTVTTLAAVSLRLTRYVHSQVHGRVLASSEVDRILSLLRGLSVAERKKIPGIQEGRADVILAGAVILQRIMARLGVSSLFVSDRGIRYGVLFEELQRLNTQAVTAVGH